LADYSSPAALLYADDMMTLFERNTCKLAFETTDLGIALFDNMPLLILGASVKLPFLLREDAKK
jgi:hypothetical protein